MATFLEVTAARIAGSGGENDHRGGKLFVKREVVMARSRISFQERVVGMMGLFYREMSM